MLALSLNPWRSLGLCLLILAGGSPLVRSATPTPIAAPPAESSLRPADSTPAPSPTPAPVPVPMATNLVVTPEAPADVTPTPTPAPDPASDFEADEMKKARDAFAKGEWELALKYVDAVIRSNPKNSDAYQLRASFYVNHKLWTRASEDYMTAYKLTPTARVGYGQAEVLFMNRAYEEARPKFAAISKDPGIGALALYKAYLCDLLGRHEQAAMDDLAVLGKDQETPEYYFANAVWNLYHNNRRVGSDWLHKASLAFDQQTFQFYMLSLSESSLVAPAHLTFTTKEGKSYKGVNGFVEEGGLRVVGSTGWETVPFLSLPADLTIFPLDVQQDIQENQIANTGDVPPDWVTFTTKDGRVFVKAMITDEGDGLFIETNHGTTVINYDQVPLPMVGFPPDLKARISAHLHIKDGHSLWTTVSFTTQDGMHYDQVRAMVDKAGVNLITSDGWVTVPFGALRKDLSEFPDTVRDRINKQIALHPERAGATQIGGDYLQSRVSFTTQDGKVYDGVKYSVSDTGVVVLTPEGWVSVAFDNLPKDLSGFPERSQALIGLKKEEYLDHLKAVKARGTNP
jgi:hypothetical protein